MNNQYVETYRGEIVQGSFRPYRPIVSKFINVRFNEIWIVERCDNEGNTVTVVEFEEQEDAECFAFMYSEKTGLPICD